MRRNILFLLLIAGCLASSSLLADAEAILRLEQVDTGDSPKVVLKWLGAPGREYELQSSSDLREWHSVAGFPKEGSGAFEEHAVETAARRQFFRMVWSEKAVPEGFVAISEGAFLMGDHTGESLQVGKNGELPVHEVNVSGFLMGMYPVTFNEWRSVYQWAVENGYQFNNAGSGKAGDHPVHSINWDDMVKWCNARSEMEGFSPAYYVDSDKSEVYRTGKYDLGNDFVDWAGGGYRLPTEAEWEKSARGGLEGQRFPWGNRISHSWANYWADFPPSDFDESLWSGYHPEYETGERPYTNPVGVFEPNGYGLFDMAGNVWERTWDRYDEAYYEQSPLDDPRGPSSENGRVIRGGSWVISAWACRVSDRFWSEADDSSNSWGFRVVRQDSGGM